MNGGCLRFAGSSQLMIAILDIDGTLVDTNYHHAIAWYRALRDKGLTVPLWVIHRHIGMGGDQMVEAITDRETEERLGEEIRERQGELYQELIDEVAPMPGARRLLERLKDLGHTVVLASSAKPEEVEHYLDLLDARELADAWTHSGDVEATKPEPDLVNNALEQTGADPEEAILIGDSRWDVEAASRAGVPAIAVRTGGYGADELSDAGATAVFESVAELCGSLERTRLGERAADAEVRASSGSGSKGP
jgi:HAD superfamily hydrolase (TIGR01509 family)